MTIATMITSTMTALGCIDCCCFSHVSYSMIPSLHLIDRSETARMVQVKIAYLRQQHMQSRTHQVLKYHSRSLLKHVRADSSRTKRDLQRESMLQSTPIRNCVLSTFSFLLCDS